ncbi:expressed unknown protein [Seminavis robusta]|uniref:Uncharacterized protein n=1 Tax=Seminavis robusta TaxID=568900 RepID=A0A9N8EJ32_9STRA|nr:expressed unknown protein [Seminavis robusta]|eukprot:Sro1079_g238940.1 n/a (408) ;mRNA; r:25008-26231
MDGLKEDNNRRNSGSLKEGRHFPIQWSRRLVIFFLGGFLVSSLKNEMTTLQGSTTRMGIDAATVDGSMLSPQRRETSIVNGDDFRGSDTNSGSAVIISTAVPTNPSTGLSFAEKMIRGESSQNIHIPNTAPPTTPSNQNSQVTTSSSTTQQQQQKLKIALYMTTHLSDQHMEFLVKCWPAAIKRLPLVQQADLLVYTSTKGMDRVFTSLGFKNVTVFHYEEAWNPMGAKAAIDENNNDLDTQKQEGAIRGLVDPFVQTNLWFESYDWVIRVNPDVLIRSDTWLLQTMQNPTVAGIFVPWDSPWHGFCFHTDFFAFRPRAADRNALLESFTLQKQRQQLHAETHLFQGFKRLYQTKDPNQQLVWLPGVNKTSANGVGHVAGVNADVQHVHSLEQHCPDYFHVSDGVTY